MIYGSMNKAYWHIYNYIDAYGVRFEHRGTVCIEVRPFRFTLCNPSNALFTGRPRRMNYRFWVAETLMYIAGWGNAQSTKAAELLVHFNSNYANFSRYVDGSPILHKMVRYGDGFGQGLNRVYNTLSDKPNSRQAYVSIWDTNTPHSYEESPCAIGAQYFIDNADDKPPSLSACYFIRSNDINWGMPYDVASFCAIQIALAGSLGMDPGNYHHHATSMHYYEAHPKTKCSPPNVNNPDVEDWLKCPPIMPGPPLRQKFTDVQHMATNILLQMHQHFIVEERKPSLFDMGYDENTQWIKDWANIIRWSWNKEGKE